MGSITLGSYQIKRRETKIQTIEKTTGNHIIILRQKHNLQIMMK